jgi:hypothetical protein
MKSDLMLLMGWILVVCLILWMFQWWVRGVY